MRMTVPAALAAIALLLAASPSEARGGQDFGGGGFARGSFPQGGFPQGDPSSGRWWHVRQRRLAGARANGAGAFARDQKHSEDPYVKAASEEEERVLKKLNSICRGC